MSLLNVRYTSRMMFNLQFTVYYLCLAVRFYNPTWFYIFFTVFHFCLAVYCYYTKSLLYFCVNYVMRYQSFLTNKQTIFFLTVKNRIKKLKDQPCFCFFGGGIGGTMPSFLGSTLSLCSRNRNMWLLQKGTNKAPRWLTSAILDPACVT